MPGQLGGNPFEDRLGPVTTGELTNFWREAFVHPDAVVIGTDCVVGHRAQVPAGALAIGVPAVIREEAGLRQQAWLKYAVQTYLDLAERHRSGLRRLDWPTAIASGPGTPE